MFHVELRRFPYVARAFNLSEAELDARIVLPLAHGLPIEFDERQWTPDKTRVTIYEGPIVATEDRGLGRGWSIVTRDGQDVTRTLLDAATERVRQSSPQGLLPGLKQQLLQTAAAGPVSLPDVVALAVQQRRGHRASESLALAEQAVWELLHEGSVTITRTGPGDAVPAQEWESLLLSWEAWADPGARVQLRRHN